MTVRKNFVFEETVAKHLEELAAAGNKSQTALLQEMVEEKYKVLSQKEKLAAFERLAGSATGAFGDSSIQKMKADSDV